MTELEKIAYAKMFIDKLANGINPLDDTKIKDEELINNIRISRCFFYVSDILRQVIDNGGVGKKSKKKPFEITKEELIKYEMVPSITISEFCRRVSELSKSDTNKLSYKLISMWLLVNGYLKEEIDENGKKRKIPTELGIQTGIYTELRVGRMGEYLGVLYNQDAQSFLIDHLIEIIESNVEE